MAEISSNNKRIAKNTLMLYIRMGLSTVVSLYTSRVVLQTLGVEDFGIYGVVGGILAMFTFLNGSMAGATSRFITFEMGKGDKERLKDTFSSALIIHIGIAFLILVLAETVGLWFLNNKLVIPEGRMGAAHWVYQCAILATIFSITQVPYNALIISHERMGIYAYIEILSVCLRLLIVFLLPIFNIDKLKLYAVLVLTVSIIIRMIYRIYCMRNFSESHFSLVFKKDILKPMLSFSGWDFYGNMCVTVRQQGTNFLINNFFGVVANGASSIATTVSGVVSRFAFNIITAFRPRIIKSYAQENWCEMQTMINNAIKFSTLFLNMLAIPFLFETSFIIQLWLGQVPQYVEPLIRLTLIANCVGNINSIIVIGIHATGRIKRISFLTGTMFLLTIPISFFLLRLGCNVETVYIVNVLSNIFIVSLNLWIIKKQIDNINILSIIKVIVLSILITLLSVILILFIYKSMDEGFIRLIAISICDLITMLLFTYILGLDRKQRNSVNNYILTKLHLKNELNS
jgi:O-antigen/teichoic acid export membrane protein